MTIIWCMVPEIWSATDRNIYHFGPFFALLLPNQNFEKMKKTPGDITILHKCTKNHSHMLHCSWDTMREEYNFYVSSRYFLPCYPPSEPKNHNFKKLIKRLEISSFYTCAPKIMIARCTVPEAWCATDGGTEKVTYRGRWRTT